MRSSQDGPGSDICPQSNQQLLCHVTESCIEDLGHRNQTWGQGGEWTVYGNPYHKMGRHETKLFYSNSYYVMDGGVTNTPNWIGCIIHQSFHTPSVINELIHNR